MPLPSASPPQASSEDLRVPLAVSVSGRCPPALHLHARERARAWGLPFVERPPREPLAPLLGTVADALLVFGTQGLVLWDLEGKLAFHPGLAHLRIKSFNGGARDDRMLVTAALRPGERVLDCTLGLGQDALVAARAVGVTGRVVGLEKSFPLYALLAEGMARFTRDPASCPVEPIHADAARYLTELPSGAFDCILFDPMWGRPGRAQQSFDALRRFADHGELTEQMVHEARRVSRRTVVVKASRYSSDLKKLHLEPERAPRNSKVLWARVPPLEHPCSTVAPQVD